MYVFRIIADAALAFYEELFFYIVTGLVNLFGWIIIIPGPFILAGIYTVGQKAVRGLGVKWRIIWDGVKEFGLRSLFLFLIVALGYGIIAANIYFYGNPDISPFSSTVGAWVTPLFLFLALVWTGVTFYAQAFLMELKQPTMLLVLRNSLFLTLLQPFQTLVLLIVAGLSLALSIGLVIPLIVWPGFVSALALTAVRTMVERLTERLEAMQADDEEEEEEEGESEEDSSQAEDDEAWASPEEEGDE